MHTLEGVSSVVNFISAYKKSQSNQESRFLICSVFFLSKGNLFKFFFSSLKLVLVPCGAYRMSPFTSS